MTDVEIRSGVPLPQKQSARMMQLPFEELNIGESFIVPDDGDKMEHVPAACIEFLSPQVRGGAPQASGGGGGTDPRIAQDQDPFSFQNTAWKQDVIFWYRCSFGDFRRAGRSHGAKSKFSTVDCARIVEGVACQRTSRAGCPSFRIFREFILHGVPIRVLESGGAGGAAEGRRDRRLESRD